MDFDGTNDFLTAGDISSLIGSDAEGTVSLWQKKTVGSAASDERPLFYWGDSGTTSQLFLLRYTDDTTLQALLKTTVDIYRATLTVIDDGLWHHIAFTNDTSGNTLYYDGIARTLSYTSGNSSTDGWFDNLLNEDELAISENSFGGFYTGQIDDVRVYNRAIPANEAESLGKSRSRLLITDGIRGWWKLDDGNDGATASGSGSAKDSSGNGNDSTPTNDPIWRASEFINYP